MTSKKKLKLRNRIVTASITLISGYILMVNNSLDFLIKFGYNISNTTVAFIGFLIIFI